MRVSSSAAILLTVAVGLAGVGAWVALGRGGSEGPAVTWPADAQGVVEEADPGGVEAGEGLAAAATLTIDVEPRALLRPPADVVPACRLVAGGRELGAELRLVAGPRAADPSAPLPGRHLAAFRLGDGSELHRVVELRADAVVDLERGAPVMIRGVVVGANGDSVEGASVWAGFRRSGGELEVATTDADGAFEFAAVPAGTGVPLTVWKAGHASRFRILDVRAPIDEPPLVVVLEPAVGLDVVFTVPVARPELGRVALAPASADAALLQYPFFLAGLLGGGMLRPDGTASIRDLPSGAAVDVWVVHSEAPVTRPVSVMLRRTEQRAVVRGTAVSVLHGVVRRPDGTPLGGVELCARVSVDLPLPGWVGSLLDAAAHRPVGASRVLSAPDGTFRIGRPGPSGACRIVLRAVGRPELEVAVQRGRGDVPHDFVVPDPAPPFGEPCAIRVHLRPQGRALRVRRGNRASVRWNDREPFEIRLGEPALVDVRIRFVADGAEPVERRFDGLVVVGPVDLRLEL